MGVATIQNYVPNADTDAALKKLLEGVFIPIPLAAGGAVMSGVAFNAALNRYAPLPTHEAFISQAVDSNTFVTVTQASRAANRFVVGAKGNVCHQITAVLNKTTSSNGSVTARILADAAGLPAEVLATSAAINHTNITLNSKAAYKFEFATPVNMPAGQAYWLEIVYTGTQSIQWFGTLSAATTLPAGMHLATHAGSWTADLTRAMTFAIVGYISTFSIDAPVTLVDGVNYDKVFLDLTSTPNTDITFEIINAATSAVIYTGLVNDQTIFLDPTQTPNIRVKLQVSYDPGLSFGKLFITSIGFKGNMYPATQRIVERSWADTNVSTAAVGPDCTITTGGLQLADDVVSVSAIQSSTPRTITTVYTSLMQPLVATKAYALDFVKLFFTGATDDAARYSDFKFVVARESTTTPGTVGETVYECPLMNMKEGRMPLTTSGPGTDITKYELSCATYEIPTFITFKKGERFFVGITGASVGAGATLSVYRSVGLPPEFGGFTLLNGVVQTDPLCLDIGYDVVEASPSITLRVPSVERQGAFYPLLPNPDGHTVVVEAYDGITGHLLGVAEHNKLTSLVLHSGAAAGFIKFVFRIKRTKKIKGQSVALVYQFEGSVVSVERAKAVKRMHFNGTIKGDAVGTIFEIRGKGVLQTMSVKVVSDATADQMRFRMAIDDQTTPVASLSPATAATTMYNFTAGLPTADNLATATGAFNNNYPYAMTNTASGATVQNLNIPFSELLVLEKHSTNNPNKQIVYLIIVDVEV